MVSSVDKNGVIYDKIQENSVELIEKAKNAERESEDIDFKEKFDPESAQDWCEIIKDIVAMANSNGGIILIGIKDNGIASGFDVTPILILDPAQVTDKIAKYTGEQFSKFIITEIDKDGNKVAAFLIDRVSIPMIFIKPGTYDIGGGKQKMAFGVGTIYFRHGAKSEPGNSNDIRKVIEKELDSIRKLWLDNIRKVVEAPPGSHVQILPLQIVESTLLSATPIRIVDESNAPAYRKIDLDHSHPYRQKELIDAVNLRLGGRKKINAYDALCIRKAYQIDETKPQFYYKPKFGTPQYSDVYLEWLVNCYEKNNSFFDNARNNIETLAKS